MAFEDFIDKVIRWEGGSAYTDNPKDAGGATRWGVTLNTLSVWRGVRVSKEDVKNLSEEEARAIYRSMFFDKPLFNLLPDAIQGQVFDFGINAGPGRAVKTLQEVIDQFNVTHVNVDGGLGPFTLGAVQKTMAEVGDDTFVNAYQDARQAFYEDLIIRYPNDEEFRVGWTNRVNDWRV